MKVLVVGASGFIGQRLVASLAERGDHVVVTGRSEKRLDKMFGNKASPFAWDPNSGPPPVEALKNVDGVINLAGEPVAKGRWTKAKKKRIRVSRVGGTRHLVEGLRALEKKPSVLVSASAVGYYGDRKHNALNEDSAPGDGFLMEVCKEWEAEAGKAREAGIRTAIVRVGVVLGRDGGAYPLMSRPFRLFVGGPIGLGKMWMSWIHIDDIVGIFLHCLDTAGADRIYNGTAPNPVSNLEFTSTLASVLRRPALFPVPPMALRVGLGAFADVITASQRVMPLRTIGVGYEFKYPKLRAALEALG
ncbi:MAG: TIGR01777 family oxidoreductase [Planctomycetota bacterium]